MINNTNNLTEIKFKIPFYEQGYNECGPICLKMVLEYFGENHSVLELKNLVESDSTGTTWAIGLVKAAASLGFKVDFYSTYLGVNPENYNLMYYVTQTDGYQESKTKVNKIVDIISKDPRVKLIEKTSTITSTMDFIMTTAESKRTYLIVLSFLLDVSNITTGLVVGIILTISGGCIAIGLVYYYYEYIPQKEIGSLSYLK